MTALGGRVALVALGAVAASFLLPWITLSYSKPSQWGGAGVPPIEYWPMISYSMLDLSRHLIARDVITSLAQLLLPILQEPIVNPAYPENLSMYVFLKYTIMLAVGFYFLAVVSGVIWFIIRHGRLLACSGAFAIASFVFAFLGAGALMQQAVDVWERASQRLIDVRTDFGAWLALAAGLVLLGNWFLCRPTRTDAQPLESARENK